MKILIPLLLGAGLLALTAGYSSAQTITGEGDTVTTATEDAPGSSSDYSYYEYDSTTGASAVLENLNDFSLTYTGNAYADTSDSYTKTPSGVPFEAGIDYNGATLLDFALTNAAESDFDVYVLTNVSGDYATGTSQAIKLSSSGSASFATLSSNTTTPENEFVEFEVTGATTGETFSITDASSPNYIAGVSFEAIPEPSTLGMLSVVLGGGLFLLARRRILAR